METQALILSPTRELAEQSQKVLLSIGDYMKVQCHACVGGKSIGEDIRRLDYGVQVVSGTPGRVYDMINRRHLRTRNIKMLVIDEGDEMLNQGFKGAAVRHLPVPAARDAGGAGVGDDAEGGAGHDEQVHERAGEDSGEA